MLWLLWLIVSELIAKEGESRLLVVVVVVVVAHTRLLLLLLRLEGIEKSALEIGGREGVPRRGCWRG